MKGKESVRAEDGECFRRYLIHRMDLKEDPSASYAVVPNRRLEDRIRELCEKILAAPESELEPTLVALQIALHEHTERFRKLAAEQIVEHIGHEEKRRSTP